MKPSEARSVETERSEVFSNGAKRDLLKPSEARSVDIQRSEILLNRAKRGLLRLSEVKQGSTLCAAVVVARGEQRTEHEFRGSEKDILEGMTRLVRDEDPDFITGYNIDNFDLPRIIERAEENSGKSCFICSRSNS